MRLLVSEKCGGCPLADGVSGQREVSLDVCVIKRNMVHRYMCCYIERVGIEVQAQGILLHVGDAGFQSGHEKRGHVVTWEQRWQLSIEREF